MARFARIVLPGIAHNITQRGNYRQPVFLSDDDRRFYLDRLRDISKREGLRILSYCLMTNHVHLVAIPDRELSLARALGQTHSLYAQRMHSRRERLGHLWQSRFYSHPMDESHLWCAIRYVEQNPVRAGMVSNATAHDWSSAAAHCRASDPSGLLDMELLAYRGAPADWAEYLNIAEDPVDLFTIRDCLRTGRPFGSDEFADRIRAQTGRAVIARRGGRPSNRPQMSPIDGTFLKK